MSVIRPIQYPADRLDRLVRDGIIPPPVFDWDFARKRNLVANGRPAITYSGGDNGTYFDHNGILRTSGADEARFDHDPVSGAPLGLLVEKVQTNRAVESETLGAVTWVKRGAVSVTVNDTIAPSGDVTADKVENLGAAGVDDLFDAIGGFSNDATLGTGFYIKKITSTGTLQVKNATAGLKGDWDVDLSAIGSEWERITATHAAVTITAAFVADATGNAGFQFIGKSGSLDMYLWGMDQKEGTLTSYIETEAAAVARTADVPSIALSDIPRFSTTEGTILVKYNFPALTGELGMLLQIDDGTGDNRIYIEKLADETIRATVRATASTTFQFTSTETFSAGVAGKVALTWKANDSNAAFNGEIGTTDTGVTIPTGLTDLHIGTNHAGGLQPNGNCASIGYWPYRTPNTPLQVLVA